MVPEMVQVCGDVAVAVKLTAVWLAPSTVTAELAGAKVYPDLLGVNGIRPVGESGSRSRSASQATETCSSPAPFLQFLDAAVGEVHQAPEGIAVSMISRWVVACLAAEPAAGAELAGSEITPMAPAAQLRGSFSAMVGQAPMLAGFTQVTVSACG